MADPLKIGVEVDVGQLEKLASASKSVAASANEMKAAFASTANDAAQLAARLLAQGVSANDAKGALINLGYSAKAAAAAMKLLASGAEDAGKKAAGAGTNIDGMTRALASGAVRIAASELGMGQLGFAFARVGAASAAIAPILASAFAIVSVVAFVQMIEHAIEAYQKWIHLGEETVHKIDDQTLSLQHESDQLDVVNIRLQNQIDKLQHKPENHLALALAEVKVQADGLSKSLEDVLQKTVAILKAGPGSASEFVLGKGNVAEIGKLIEPLERQLQLASMSNDKEAQKNILLREQTILQKALTDEQAQQMRWVSGSMGPARVGRTPDQDALNTFQSVLKGVQDQLDKIAKTGKEGELEVQLANAKTAEEREKALLKYEELMGKIYEDGVKWTEEGAKHELEAIEKRTRLEEEAQRKLDEQVKKNEEEAKKDAREAEDAWQRGIEARIHGEEEVQRVSQKGFEDKMRDIHAQESLSTAGIGRGPLTSAIESTSLKSQGAVAAQAMQEAQAAAANYQNELDIVKSAMAEVNQNTEEGVAQFKDLEKQMRQLENLMLGASSAADRWGAKLKEIQAQQKNLNLELTWKSLGTTMTASANAGFNAFNSSFTKMLAGGMSFTRLMQTAWTSMVNTFVTSILKMGEQWITTHIIMAAAQKTMELLGIATHTASVASQIAENKALALSEAGLAGAGGVASMAAAPFPIDLSAPAFGAAMAAAAAGFAAFEQGGIVTANLHEGEMVLPRHLSTFVQTAAASAGGIGGPGGPGGRGGDGGSAGTTNNRVNLTVHNHGGAMDENALAKMLTRELRRRNVA
jgi:hypothetical protein